MIASENFDDYMKAIGRRVCGFKLVELLSDCSCVLIVKWNDFYFKSNCANDCLYCQMCLLHFFSFWLSVNLCDAFCRCGVCDPPGGESDQAQSDSDRGRRRGRLPQVSEHLQNHWNKVQAQRAVRGDDRRRPEDDGQFALRSPGKATPMTGVLFLCSVRWVNGFVSVWPADRGVSGGRKACAETELGWQRD